jgi:hypothetical protein
MRRSLTLRVALQPYDESSTRRNRLLILRNPRRKARSSQDSRRWNVAQVSRYACVAVVLFHFQVRIDGLTWVHTEIVLCLPARLNHFTLLAIQDRGELCASQLLATCSLPGRNLDDSQSFFEIALFV